MHNAKSSELKKNYFLLQMEGKYDAMHIFKISNGQLQIHHKHFP